MGELYVVRCSACVYRRPDAVVGNTRGRREGGSASVVDAQAPADACHDSARSQKALSTPGLLSLPGDVITIWMARSGIRAGKI